MQNQAVVTSILDGQFYTKVNSFKLVELKDGDSISIGSTIIADDNNTSSSEISLQLDSNSTISINQGELLLDSTLFNSNLSLEENTFYMDSLAKFFESTNYLELFPNSDFSNINLDLQTILSEKTTSEETLSNLQDLTLNDVLHLANEDKTLLLFSEDNSSVTFKNTNDNSWQKLSSTETINNKVFNIYIGSGDENLLVKVEESISDGITS